MSKAVVVKEKAEKMISELLPMLLEKLGNSRDLKSIVRSVVEGEDGFDLRRTVERQVQTRLTAQEGRTGCLMLARAIYKQVDGVMEAEARGLSLADRLTIVQELCDNAARELVGAAAEISAYAAIVNQVREAKEASDARKMSEARRNRSLSNERLKTRLLNCCRALVGDDLE